MKATDPATQHGRRGRRGRAWLPLSVGVALVAVAGVVAALAMGSSSGHDPQVAFSTATPGTNAGQSSGTDATTSAASGTPNADAVAAPTSASTLPTASSASSASPTTSPHPSTTAHTPGATTASASRTSASSTPGHSPTTASNSLGGRIQPGVTYQGVATEYSAGDGDGACLFGPSSDMMIAAMNEADYQTSQACGAHILVRASNGATVTVLITNECPYPCAPGQLDLSQQAFAKLADPKAGRIPITWQLISPSTSTTIALRYKTGSSQYWCAVQVVGARNPVARLEVNTGSGWQQLPRTGYNYFLSANGSGCGKPIRITDVFGQQLTATGVGVKPNVLQGTGLQFAQH